LESRVRALYLTILLKYFLKNLAILNNDSNLILRRSLQ